MKFALLKDGAGATFRGTAPKLLWMLLFALSLAVVGCATPEDARQPAKPISGETFAHGDFSLENLAGQPVVVNFWFPSCGPCRTELPELEEAYQTFKDRGVTFVGVQQLGIDTEQDAINLLDELGVSYPNIPDRGFLIQLDYNIITYPTTIFLDSDHRVARTWGGQIRKDDLDKEINRLLN